VFRQRTLTAGASFPGAINTVVFMAGWDGDEDAVVCVPVTDSNGTAGEFAEISAAANLAGMAAFVFVMRAGEKSNRGLAGLHGSLSFSLAGPFLEGCVC